ncbi:MAG TPA: hypothetical protein VIY51_26955 [Xanthobacteraceae bacterium]
MANSSNTAKEGGKESGNGAAADIQADLQALREDVARLARQVGDLFAAHGGEAWQRARAGVDEAIAEAEGAGRDAIDAVREVGGNMRGAIDVSLKQRPYTTLALAFAIGFFLGTTRR